MKYNAWMGALPVAGIILGTVLFSSCGEETTPVPTPAPPTVEPYTSAVSASPLPPVRSTVPLGTSVRDKFFFELLNTYNVRVLPSKQKIYTDVAQEVCNNFRQGGNLFGAVAVVLQSQLRPEESARVIRASIKSYCSEYNYLAPKVN